jgi:hypothetical protein
MTCDTVNRRGHYESFQLIRASKTRAKNQKIQKLGGIFMLITGIQTGNLLCCMVLAHTVKVLGEIKL